jgi:GNAT superfamily N-acetyltransferase
MASIEIHPLSKQRLNDWLHYFDHVAFADNPDWQSCYCHFLHADTSVKPWSEWTGEENRHAVIPLIEQRGMNGLLACADGEVVGWVNAGPSRCISAVDERPGANDDGVGTIGCFVIAKPWRGQGIARQLLQAACERMKSEGMHAVQAYPKRETKSDADAHFGPLSLYLDEGFSIWQDVPGDRLLTVRKTL